MSATKQAGTNAGSSTISNSLSSSSKAPRQEIKNKGLMNSHHYHLQIMVDCLYMIKRCHMLKPETLMLPNTAERPDNCPPEPPAPYLKPHNKLFQTKNNDILPLLVKLIDWSLPLWHLHDIVNGSKTTSYNNFSASECQSHCRRQASSTKILHATTEVVTTEYFCVGHIVIKKVPAIY